MTPLMLLAGLIELSTALPYIRDVRLGKTYPALVSWATWLFLAVIAATASFAANAIMSGIISSAIALECFVIIVFSFKKGQITYSRFDAFCQLGALSGLLLWWWTSEPLLALMFFVFIDAIGALPTFRHAWRRPGEETFSTFALSILANSLALTAVSAYSIHETLIPAYLLVMNIILSGTIFFRNRIKITSSAHE